MKSLSLLIITDKKSNKIKEAIPFESNSKMLEEHRKRLDDDDNVSIISTANPEAFAVGETFVQNEYSYFQIAKRISSQK